MNRAIVYLAFNRWDSIKQREQHLVEHLASDRVVLYIEPYFTLRRVSFASLRGRLRRIRENLFVYEPPNLFFPLYSRLRVFSEINGFLSAWLYRRVIDQLGLKEFVLGVGHPRSMPTVRGLTAAQVYYDCMDDHGAFPIGGLNFTLIADYERQLLQRSDLVFASSRKLADQCSRQNEQVRVLGNGVNAEHFLGLAERDDRIPADLQGVSGPIIGYYGAIAPWLDLEGLLALATQRPNYQLVLIGPIEHGLDLSVLTGLENVHYLGPKPYAELPAYLKRFDVALIPFRMIPLIEKVNPTKFYEYLAAGKRIVSSPLPDVAAHAALVYLYHEANMLAETVDEALREDGEHLRTQREAIALKHTWSELADRMLRCLVGEEVE